MKIDSPTPAHTGQLPEMWKEAFGDYGGFWEMFLDSGFSPERCRCVLEQDTVTAALCWFHTTCSGQEMAYIYAVITRPDHRGRGLCRMLIEDTHRHLASLGYTAALLVPAEEGLRGMYRKMGYQDCTSVSEFSCAAGGGSVPLRAIGPGEFSRLRRRFLPKGGVLQEGENLTFLAQQAQFYTGEDVLMAAYAEEDTLHAMELLGNIQAAPGILTALNCRQGNFRTPGTEKAFAMFHPLTANATAPGYFGFAFD